MMDITTAARRVLGYHVLPCAPGELHFPLSDRLGICGGIRRVF